MKIKFYGVRGSYPVPGEDTAKFGGNTTCVTFTKENIKGTVKQRLIIDSGTGIISLGKEIISNFFAEKEGNDGLDIQLFFTHLHPDHTQGFPFFAPNFFKKANITLYGMETLHKHIGEILEEAMCPPNFPIEYRDLKSKRSHVLIEDGSKFIIGDFKIEAMKAFAPSHPQQGAVYYKITDLEENKSVACIWDNEGKVSGDKAVINFTQGVDVLIHDTQYTSPEYANDKMVVQGFGHSTYEMALDVARQAKVKYLVCMHYNPSHTDINLFEQQRRLRSINGITTILAYEGFTMELTNKMTNFITL